MRTSLVIASTNRLGKHEKERPVHFKEVLATLYQNLVIDVSATTLRDFNGGPRYLVDLMQPLPGLI